MTQTGVLAATMAGHCDDPGSAAGGRMRLETGTVDLPVAYPAGGIVLSLPDFDRVNHVTVQQTAGTPILAMMTRAGMMVRLILYQLPVGNPMPAGTSLSGLAFEYLVVGRARV